MAFRYDDKFKADAIARVNAANGEETLGAIAEDLGVNANTLARWRDAADAAARYERPKPPKVPKETPPPGNGQAPAVPVQSDPIEAWLDARVEASVRRVLSRLKVSIQ